METIINFFYKVLYILLTGKDKAYGVIPYYQKNGQTLFFIAKNRAGRWVFPKGHALVGEKELMAAKRELAEEAGITDCQLDSNKTFTQNYHLTLYRLIPVL